MIELALLVVLGTLGNAAIVEIHCRLQQQHIAKPKNTSRLIKHYLLMSPFICGMLLFVYFVKVEINNLEVAPLSAAFLLLGITILFLFPVIYIMDWRYPGLTSKMEKWRKGLPE